MSTKVRAYLLAWMGITATFLLHFFLWDCFDKRCLCPHICACLQISLNMLRNTILQVMMSVK